MSDNPYYLGSSAEPARRQAFWRQFLTARDPKEARVREDTWVLGDEAFRQRVAVRAGRPVPRPRGRPAGKRSLGQMASQSVFYT